MRLSHRAARGERADRPACAELPRWARRCAAARWRMSTWAAPSRARACMRRSRVGGWAAAPVRRALAGAGTRPCGLRARPSSGTRPSSSARRCSRSTAASAGPPPTRRTGRRTCARPARSRAGACVTAGSCQHAACRGAPHPVHQQPTGRSVGVRRRRSSRPASGWASAATHGATSASKRVTAAATAATSC